MRIGRLWKWPGLALLLVLTLAAAGCSRGKTDAQLAGEVQNQIQSHLASPPVTVTAKDGIVTLSGTVPSEDDRRRAAQEAAQVEGVKVVVNDLQVMPAAASIPEAPAPSSPRQGGPAVRRSSSNRHRAAAAPVPEAPAPLAPAYAEPAPALPPPAPVPVAVQKVTLPAGTRLSVRMIDGIDSERNRVGDVFRATLEAPLTAEDRVVVPAGTEVEGRVIQLKSAGHFSGRSEFTLELIRLDLNGRSYPLQTDTWNTKGNSRGARTAATIGGASAAGAIIGAIAGGGKGAAIGAAAGAGAGTGVQAITKGKQVKVNPEAVLDFRLTGDLTVVPSSRRNSERQQLEEQQEE
jgi:hypothetical protein